MKKEELKLTKEWDKTFPRSEKTEHSKVTFVNHFGEREAAGDRRMRSVRGMQGAGIGSLCADNGGTRLSYDCF